MKNTLAILTILFLLLVKTDKAQCQIIINPGFETGSTAGWRLDGDALNPGHWNIVSSPTQAGSFALMEVNMGKFIGQTFSPIAVSDIQDMSFWIYTTLDANIHIRAGYSDLTFQNIMLTNTSGSYNHKNYSSYLNSSKSIISFDISSYYASSPGAGNAYYDSFALSTVPEAKTAWSLLIAALFFLCLARANKSRRGSSNR